VPDYDLVMKIIKDFALVIGIVVAITSLVVHWKAIVRPDLQRIEERRFKAVEDLYSFLSDYRFLSVYAGKQAIPAVELATDGAFCSPLKKCSMTNRIVQRH
jgi:hypothetical protein